MAEKEFVRYCLLNHAVRFSGLCPSTCPVCGSKFDLSRPPVPASELKTAPRPAQTQTPAVAPVPVRPEEVPRPAKNQTPAAVSVPIRPEAGAGPEQASPRRTAAPEAPVRFDPFGTGAGDAPGRGEKTPSPSSAPAKNSPRVRTLQLSYFGTPIRVPVRGEWLGREGLGAELLEGNRLVSRRHVFVRPDQNRRLLVQDDRSLNGVFYDKGDGRQKLEKGSSVLLKAGDTLWLYNVPLKVEEEPL